MKSVRTQYLLLNVLTYPPCFLIQPCLREDGIKSFAAFRFIKSELKKKKSGKENDRTISEKVAKISGATLRGVGV